MNSAAAIILSCFVLLIVQHSANAINCYSCTAGTDGCSASGINKNGAGVMTTADSSLAYCTKTVVSNNNNYASRSYSPTGSCSASSTSSTLYGVTSTVYCCSTDLCNSAYTQAASVVFAIIAAAIGLFLVK